MNPDFKDLLCIFNARGVEYLVVGAHALAAYGRVRATKDLDIWVRPDASNARRVLAALDEFGAPLHDLTEADLCTPGVIFQVGVAPVRIDILTSIAGVEFADAWPARQMFQFGGAPATVLSKEHLIQAKRATGRTQDRADVEWLDKLGRLAHDE